MENKKKALPPRLKKVDISVNGDAEELSINHREVERKLRPLRINEKITILITPDKCNDDYRKLWMKKNKMTWLVVWFIENNFFCIKMRTKTLDDLLLQYERLSRLNTKRLQNSFGERKKDAPYAAVRQRENRIYKVLMNAARSIGEKISLNYGYCIWL